MNEIFILDNVPADSRFYLYVVRKDGTEKWTWGGRGVSSNSGLSFPTIEEAVEAAKARLSFLTASAKADYARAGLTINIRNARGKLIQTVGEDEVTSSPS